MEGRKALPNNPQFIEQFREDWHHGRGDKDLASLKAKMGLPDLVVPRDFNMMNFDGAPISE